MNLSKELIEQAKDIKSIEDLSAKAKALGLNLEGEELEKAFEMLKNTGALADEELANVSGGCGSSGSHEDEDDHPGLSFEF